MFQGRFGGKILTDLLYGEIVDAINPWFQVWCLRVEFIANSGGYMTRRQQIASLAELLSVPSFQQVLAYRVHAVSSETEAP